MTISFNWLKDYIQTEATLAQITETLTAIGLEVEGIEKFESVRGGLEGLVIGEVLSKEKHPNADKLSCTTVDLGDSLGIQKIVCGAPNIAAGQRVIVAPVGTTIFPFSGEPFQIKAAKIRGEESNGMICAEDEIGLGSDHDGIKILPKDAPIGMQANNYFNIATDTILEINLTPNRTDAMSHIGIARDLAAGLNAKGIKAVFKKPTLQALDVQLSEEFKVSINHPLCGRYTTVLVKNITQKPSPDWLKNRLQAIGIKPINHLVDITNYVLHEYGQPLHAFDFDKIQGGNIQVRPAIHQESFTTLDGNQVKLDSEDIVIADAAGALCIAGIYGGQHSGVSSSTTNILLESANFDATAIRKTSQRLHLRTDAAQKFEKCADINITLEALQRAAALIKEEYPEAIFSPVTDIYPQPVKNYAVGLRLSQLEMIAGRKIDKTKAITILKDLGIEVVGQTEVSLQLLVPTFKAEVLREEDIIEEILRIEGYDLIPFPSKLRANLSFSKGISRHQLNRHISDFLVGMGFNEIMCNTITQSKYTHPTTSIKLINSMTSELDSMRSSLLYGGLEVIQFNNNRDNKDLKLYEFGSVYALVEGKYKQNNQLAIWCTGKSTGKNWLSEGQNTDFFHLKSCLENVLNKYTNKSYQTAEIHDEEMTYGLSFVINQKVLAKLGKTHSKSTKMMDLKQEVFYAEIDMDALLKIANQEKVLYKEVSKFPSVRRDLAMIIDDQVSFEQVRQIATKSIKGILQEVNLFDVFKGEKIGAGKKSYAITFKLGDAKKTLTEKEIEKSMNELIAAYEREIKAEIRKG